MSVIFVLSIKRKHFRIFILHYSIKLYNTYEKFEEANGEPKPANKKKDRKYNDKKTTNGRQNVDCLLLYAMWNETYLTFMTNIITSMLNISTITDVVTPIMRPTNIIRWIIGAVVVVISWWLDLQLPMQSRP